MLFRPSPFFKSLIVSKERYIRWRDITWRDIPGHILYLTYFCIFCILNIFCILYTFFIFCILFSFFLHISHILGGGVMVPKKVIQLTRHFEPSLSSIPKNLKQKFKCHSSSPMDWDRQTEWNTLQRQLLTEARFQKYSAILCWYFAWPCCSFQYFDCRSSFSNRYKYF